MFYKNRVLSVEVSDLEGWIYNQIEGVEEVTINYGTSSCDLNLLFQDDKDYFEITSTLKEVFDLNISEDDLDYYIIEGKGITIQLPLNLFKSIIEKDQEIELSSSILSDCDNNVIYFFY